MEETPAPRRAVLPGYDGTPLFLRRWLPPDAAPRATVVLAHGYAEHGGRYGALAARLTQRGLALAVHDQRGYGRSGGPTAFVHSFDEYVADLHLAVQHARSERPEAPLFLMGHSMGGAVALLYCLDHGARPAGLVLSSPMLRLTTPVPLQYAGRLAGRVAPSLPAMPLEEQAVSRDPAVVEEMERDPLCYSGYVRARTGAEFVRVARHLTPARMQRLALPLLLFHGTADRITDPAGSRALYAHASSPDKTLMLLNGFYHETFNDPGGARVWASVAGWIDERAARRGTDAQERPAGAQERPAGAQERPAGAQERPAGAQERPAGGERAATEEATQESHA